MHYNLWIGNTKFLVIAVLVHGKFLHMEIQPEGKMVISRGENMIV